MNVAPGRTAFHVKHGVSMFSVMEVGDRAERIT